MSTYDARLAALEKDVAVMKQDIIYKLDETNTAVTMLQGVIGNQGKDIKHIKRRLNDMDQRFDDMDQRFDKVEATMAAMENRILDTTRNDMAAMENRILDTTRNDMAAMENRILDAFKQVVANQQRSASE